MAAKNEGGVRWRYAIPAALVAFVAAAGMSAYADISSPVLTIHAESGSSVSQSVVIEYDDGIWDPAAKTYTWSLSSSIDLMDGSTRVGTLDGADLVIDAGDAPEITLTLDVTAGSGWTDFYADTGYLTFPSPIAADEAAARLIGSGEVWDQSDPANEVWMVGLHAPSYSCFQGRYNDDSVFASVLGVVGMPSGGSGYANGSEPQPSSGYAPLNEIIVDMSLAAAFQLSPDDRSVVTGVYGFETGGIPEPATFALVFLGGMLVAARRRG